MAQKAAKQLAARNTAILKRTHLISLAVNALFIILRFIIFRPSCTRVTYFSYGLLAGLAFALEVWLERIGRPTVGPIGELKKAGEDLEAKGLTEYMWDILYWTWGCIVTAAIFGDKAWWGWIVVPLYSIWLAWSTFRGVREGIAGMAGGNNNGEVANGSASNRQKKMEKRGGQKMQYR
ncbi:MAG: hypothetical protein Q9170_008144 [Blastenia crenularia]